MNLDGTNSQPGQLFELSILPTRTIIASRQSFGLVNGRFIALPGFHRQCAAFSEGHQPASETPPKR